MVARTRKIVRFVGGAVGVSAALVAGGTFGASANAGPVVVAGGLDNPRGLAFDADGSLLVAEAGHGGSGTCVPGLFSERMCIGASGALVLVGRDGTTSRVVKGLPSLADPVTGGFAFGPSDVSAARGTTYLSVGGPTSFLDRSAFPEPYAKALGTVRRVSGGRSTRIADLAAFELAKDPDGQAHESNAQSVLATDHKLYALDAAGNTFFRVRHQGRLRLLKTFANRTAGGVEFQAVPSALAKGPDGAIYITELTGAPFPEGQSRVLRWTRRGTTVYAKGFTSAEDLAFGPDGSLYVVEIFPGRVVRVKPDGTRSIVASGLTSPSGIAVGRDGSVYVSDCGTCAGIGRVLRFTP